MKSKILSQQTTLQTNITEYYHVLCTTKNLLSKGHLCTQETQLSCHHPSEPPRIPEKAWQAGNARAFTVCFRGSEYFRPCYGNSQNFRSRNVLKVVEGWGKTVGRKTWNKLCFMCLLCSRVYINIYKLHYVILGPMGYVLFWSCSQGNSSSKTESRGNPLLEDTLR